MSQNLQEKAKTCAYCEKVLHGRSDQVYCNDNCRNTFNRQKRAAERIIEHENTPAILSIIKRNYEILKQRNTVFQEDEGAFTNTAKLLADGFNPKFFTSITTDKQGMKWRCIFERGFSMGEEITIIQDFPKQDEI